MAVLREIGNIGFKTFITVPRAIVPSIAEIQDWIRHVPESALMNWLATRRLPHTKSRGRSLAASINRWITDDRMAVSDLFSAVFDIEENGAKKVFLRSIIGEFPQNQNEFRAFLERAGVPIAARSKRSLRNDNRPMLNHTIWEDNAGNPLISVKYSELQTDIKFDAERRTYEEIPRPVFIIIKTEVLTGFTEFRFDAPAKTHIHKDGEGKSSETIYENHYFDSVRALYGAGIQIGQIGLNDVADFLESDDGRNIFRINRDLTTVSGNGRQTFSVGRGDVRDLPARIGAASADGDNWIFDDVTGYWNPAVSNGTLTGELFMRLFRDSSSVKFHRECLAIEMNYAIKQIRDIKERVQGNN